MNFYRMNHQYYELTTESILRNAYITEVRQIRHKQSCEMRYASRSLAQRMNDSPHFMIHLTHTY